MLIAFAVLNVIGFSSDVGVASSETTALRFRLGCSTADCTLLVTPRLFSTVLERSGAFADFEGLILLTTAESLTFFKGDSEDHSASEGLEIAGRPEDDPSLGEGGGVLSCLTLSRFADPTVEALETDVRRDLVVHSGLGGA